MERDTVRGRDRRDKQANRNTHTQRPKQRQRQKEKQRSFPLNGIHGLKLATTEILLIDLFYRI